ncbi:MAG TPA: type II secretion system minor pseudopilin GspK [Steroidobacteraceae bacterium]|nr:type II secretion system minor pseudopilin GspK [Steroidobacteraceae bacterium]
MALIIALILVALATILATKLSFDVWIERQRTAGVLATEQALHFAMGGEALAADVLSHGQSGGPDTLADSWAQPTQPIPLTSDNTPDGEPLGTLQGTLEDMQGRFNLNSLLRVLPNGKPDPFPLEQFQRLLVSVGLEPKWAGIARDWVDADDVPGIPDGAEDAVYTSQIPPYRAGNWPMTSPSELMALPGFGADRYRKIAPYVTALPSATAAINICTAPAEVLESLAESLNGEYSGNPDFLSKGRKSGCFPELATFRNILGQVAAAKLAGRFGDKTSYFQLTTRVVIGNSEFTWYSLLQRSTGGKVTPLLRTFGSN